ncbi:uncharacterized protein [Haliotis cracherodii]|uniref:uncharacterized protein n=1 Tax=Haliotis cracherodii TaxID=6455 RepID=UPI0039E93F24
MVASNGLGEILTTIDDPQLQVPPSLGFSIRELRGLDKAMKQYVTQGGPVVKKEEAFTLDCSQPEQVTLSSKSATHFPRHTKVAYRHFPQLPVFSGTAGKDADYDVWRYEVNCLIESKTHDNSVILQAIRQPLKGEAALIVMKLGHHASIVDILSKLKSAFGTLRRSSSLFSEFYSSYQQNYEDVTAWSCRLERLLYQLAGQKQISSAEQDEMLRSRLWDGLETSLKSLAAHKYESISDFDELRLCLRENLNRTEPNQIPRSPSRSMDCNQPASKSDDIAELKGMIKDLTTSVADLRDQHQQLSAQVYQQQPSFGSTAHGQQYGRRPLRSRGRGQGG